MALDTMSTRNMKAKRMRTLPADCLIRIVEDPGSVVVLPVNGEAVTATAGMNGNGSNPSGSNGKENGVITVGRLEYRAGFEDVWVGSEHYDLRDRTKARLCIQYLVEQKAFDVNSARHLKTEIDEYVRREGDFPRSADIKIDHYFNDPHDPKKKLPGLRKALIEAAGRKGRYFLKVS